MIETPAELAEDLADWVGIYGCHTEDPDDEECILHNNCRPEHCRTAFVADITQRIRDSVRNEKLLGEYDGL